MTAAMPRHDPIPAALRELAPTTLVERLAGFPAVLAPLVNSLSPEESLWRPAPEDWSVVEAVRHLLDEEREDFRPRIERVLADSTEPWTPIDPAGAAASRGYREQPLPPVLAEFEQERARSVTWLRSLLAAKPPTDWRQAYEHPRFGPIHAGDLLAAWAAHDLLHLRQITRRLFQMLAARGEPYRVDYAGEW